MITLPLRSIVLRWAAPAAAALLFALAGTVPAGAIVGGGDAPAEVASGTVLIVSTRGASCTGAMLGTDLVLTAAHCVEPTANYAVAVLGEGQPRLIAALRVAVHPAFEPEQFRTRRPTPDVALVKLSEPLPPQFRPVRLGGEGLPARGETFLVAGFGMSADGAEKTAGKLRAVALVSIGTTGGIMVRLAPAAGPGGACTGDSGGPVFQNGVVVGTIGWATGPNGARGCGGVTGVTLAGFFRDWIHTTAKSLGSPLGTPPGR